ncbi:YbaB/EbfC family nucleoid-associated protein [Salininema proteolyticum]|uniref:YbaB/EbfC family nucleoid-associated protein n=1 Tax=Salininema proteolyticum TaxID=1607685 RepID=A0ABV8U222_9ACTN
MPEERPMDLAEAMAKIEQIQKNAQDTLAKVAELEAEHGADETTATSENGMVTVVLDSDGEITGITIDDSALRLRGNLVGVVLETIREAQGTHAMKLAKMAEQAAPGIGLSDLVESQMPAGVRDRARDNLG